MPLSVLEVFSRLRGDEIRGMPTENRHLAIDAHGRMTVARNVQVGQSLSLDFHTRTIVRKACLRNQDKEQDVPDSSHNLPFFCIWAVVAKVLIDEVEVLVGYENHVAVEALPHLDEVLSAGRNDASHTAVTARQRCAVSSEDAHIFAANCCLFIY